MMPLEKEGMGNSEPTTNYNGSEQLRLIRSHIQPAVTQDLLVKKSEQVGSGPGAAMAIQRPTPNVLSHEQSVSPTQSLTFL